MGNQTKVGVSDVIVVNANVENIDIGLIKNKICDLKLDKYISKVTVKTNNGTKEQAYDNTKLAKVEIKSKELQGAIVVVEYKIVVTNEGELPTSVTKIVDYIPSGLTFSSELNKQWSMNVRGELETSLSGQKLEPGQSTEISLTLIKSMTVNSTGTFTNSAEISEISNSLNIKDEDSIPGNKVESEDDYSKAELIISVSTGTVVCIFIILGISIIAIGIIFLNIRFGFRNITKFSLIFIVSLCYMCINIKDVDAYHFPEILYFKHVEEIYSPTTFDGYKNSNYTNWYIRGVCNLDGGNYGGKDGRKYEIYKEEKLRGSPEPELIKSDNISINRENSDDDVVVEYENENYRIGPLKISGDENNKYIFSLILGNSAGEIKENIEVELDGINGKIKTYYLKINQKYIGNNNITKIQCVAKRDRNLKYKYQHYIQAYYKPLYNQANADTMIDGWPTWEGKKYQSVQTNSKLITWEETETKKDQLSGPIEWEIKNGDLEVEKVDNENYNIKLQGVKFYLKRKDDGKYVKEGNVISYESKAKDATLFETGEDGKRKIKDLRMGEYIIEEISNPYYGYTKMETSNVYVRPGMVKQFVFKNTKQTGNLKIKKQDADSGKILEGVSFRIKRKDKNKYVQVKVGDDWKKDITGIVHVDDMQTVDTENEATIFTTNSDGIIEVRNILKGTYYVEEVSVGDIYFGYEVDDDYITWSYTSTANEDNTGSGKGHIATVEVGIIESYNTTETPREENINETIIFKNKRKYIKLSGYAWEDERVGGKDNIPGNEKCDVEENTEGNTEEDKRLANVLVKLYSWDGRTLGQTITDEKGNYVFGTKSMADINGDKRIDTRDVTEMEIAIISGKTNKKMDINNDGIIDNDDVEYLRQYLGGKIGLIDVKIEDIYNSKTKATGYVEFTYNGLNYETVSVNLQEENTNKVAEISSNSQNQVDKSIDGTYLDNRTSFNKSWAVIENNKKIDSDGNVDTLDYNHNNDTSSLSYPGGITGYNEQKYPIIVKDNTNNNIFNITARTETNTSEDASCKVFGQNKTMEMILSDKEQYIDTIENINLGVTERAQPNLALTKDIYSAKVTVNGYEHTYMYNQKFVDKDQNEDEFNVDVKFGEKFGNKSFTRAIYPSDVKETQDKDFSVKVVYIITLKNGSGVLYSKINSLVDYFDARYTIEENGAIGTGYENGKIKDEIRYKLDRSYQDAEYRKLIINCDTKINPNESNKNIYVEYTLTRNGVKDILFDKNGNQKTNIEGLENIVEINSYSTYSDKDFTKSYAGIDSNSNPGSTVPGNKDTYEDDTDYAPGLILEVANPREIKGTVFEDNAVDPTEGGTNRERLGNGKFDDGEKTISGVQVGLYKEADFEEIKDEDGKIIDMQLRSKAKPKPVGTTTYGGDNKDSTGKDGAFTIKDFAPGEYRIVYFWGDGKYTIEDYKSTIWTSDNKNEKDGNPNTWYRVNTHIRYSDAKDNYATRLKIDSEDTSIDKMDSMTNIDKMDSKTNSMTFGVELKDDIYNRKTETSGIDKVTFSIENIDFGVIERPRQSIDVTKRAKSMKITLANGQVIADAKIVEKDGKLQLEQQVKGVIYTEPSDKNNPKNGQIKAEIDNELIQGATVEIKYEIKVQNNSEIDYDSKGYYCYGEKGEEIVKIKASGVYDYLDNTMIANDENTEWETKTIVNYNEKVSKPTIMEEYFKYQSSSIDSSGNTEIRVWYEEFKEQYATAIKNWNITEIKEARKKKLADKTILHNANLEGEIAPGDSKQASLTASKILTNTDEIELNNDIEITEATRNKRTGRKVTPQYSFLYDRGETVTITTPTGENKNYILITIVAISFFVILGTGIVFIKKKILK